MLGDGLGERRGGRSGLAGGRRLQVTRDRRRAVGGGARAGPTSTSVRRPGCPRRSVQPVEVSAQPTGPRGRRVPGAAAQPALPVAAGATGGGRAGARRPGPDATQPATEGVEALYAVGAQPGSSGPPIGSPSTGPSQTWATRLVRGPGALEGGRDPVPGGPRADRQATWTRLGRGFDAAGAGSSGRPRCRRRSWTGWTSSPRRRPSRPGGGSSVTGRPARTVRSEFLDPLAEDPPEARLSGRRAEITAGPGIHSGDRAVRGLRGRRRGRQVHPGPGAGGLADRGGAYRSWQTFEPGDTAVGRTIRRAVLDPATGDLSPAHRGAAVRR